MLQVRTHLSASPTHGDIGVFAATALPAGTHVWQFHKDVDKYLSLEEILAMSEAQRSNIEGYLYPAPGSPGLYVLRGDNFRHMGHSAAPNTMYINGILISSRPIAAGEEITCNYAVVGMRLKPFNWAEESVIHAHCLQPYERVHAYRPAA